MLRKKRATYTSVGYTDHVRGLVHSALKLPLVATRIWVRVDRVETLGADTIPGLAESTVCAVRAVKRIVEGIPESPDGCVRRALVLLIELVVSLEQHSLLRVDERLRSLEVQIRFDTSA